MKIKKRAIVFINDQNTRKAQEEENCQAGAEVEVGVEVIVEALVEEELEDVTQEVGVMIGPETMKAKSTGETP